MYNDVIILELLREYLNLTKTTMDIQIATLCDHAADYNGKMIISGTFETLAARQFPVVHPHCCLALRICVTPEDTGAHKMAINFIDEDGKQIDPKMPLKADFPVELPDSISFLSRNLVLNLQGLKFEKEGVYFVDVSIDEELMTRVPLRVVDATKLEQQQQAAQ